MTITNIITIDLTAQNLKTLQTLAKEFKVKNWWKMKKTALIEELEKVQSIEKEKATQKKSGKKARKAPKTEEELENLVTIKELASEFGMKPAKARRILRSSFGLATTDGKTRWEWNKDSEELTRVRAIFNDKKTSAK